MAAHSNILAQEVPWKEEPGGLQSTGLQRVRPDWAHTHTHTHTHTPGPHSICKNPNPLQTGKQRLWGWRSQLCLVWLLFWNKSSGLTRYLPSLSSNYWVSSGLMALALSLLVATLLAAGPESLHRGHGKLGPLCWPSGMPLGVSFTHTPPTCLAPAWAQTADTEGLGHSRGWSHPGLTLPSPHIFFQTVKLQLTSKVTHLTEKTHGNANMD